MGESREAGALGIGAFARQAGMPLYRQLHDRIRDAILSGELRPGAKLPSSRVLAAQLPASRTIVQLAYDMLVAEGYLIGRGAKGTIVAPLASTALGPPVRPAPGAGSNHPAPRRAIQPFQLGLPALDLFPRKLWSRHAARVTRQLGAAEMHFQGPLGLERLRRAVAGYLAVARGVACTAEQVLITAGFQGALAIAAATLLRPGDRVWVEDPGYRPARRVLALLGAQLVPVPVDAEGLEVEVARARAADARMAVITPSHQFPTGVALSLARRSALLQWAREAGAWVIEDDYDSEFRYQGRPLPALQGLDPDGRVLYVGSFSKVLFPALRLGYLVAPATLVEDLAKTRRLLDGHPPMLDQMTVAAFIEDGDFTRHIMAMRALYAERRMALAAALEDVLGDLVRLELTAGGMHLLAHLPPGYRDAEVVERATRAGQAAWPLSLMAIRRDAEQGLLLGFTGLPAELARSEVEMLRAAVLG